MRVEPSGPARAPGRASGSVLIQTSAQRGSRPAASSPPLPVAARDAALIAAAVLTAAGRGDVWTLAIALGVSDASALTTLIVTLVGVATIARAGSAGLADVAGGQAVLGAAGFTGATVAVAAAWTAAISLLLAGRDRWTGVVLGAFAGTLVAGPSPAGGLKAGITWAAAMFVGGALGWLATASERRVRWQRPVALVCAIAAVSLSVVAGYR